MQEYYFLFALAFIWTLAAVVQDLKTREVANWLNFSLITFALAYRAFYSVLTNNPQFFILGLLGFIIFFALAYAFYYAKAFAGGDAKLLMGYGAILPFTNYQSLFTLTISFIFILFLAGAIYSLIYSLFIANKNKKILKKEITKRWKKHSLLFYLSTLTTILLTIYGFYNSRAFLFLPIPLIPLLYLYTVSLDKCMIKLYPPNKLTEGDWLQQNVKISKNKIIKKTVHGLSFEEIKLLKKHNKSVLIKEGIPFTPAFLLALIILIYFFQNLTNLISFYF